MHDVAIRLEDRSGALAEMGDVLGRAGISIEGGGAFAVDGVGIAHFLFVDGHAARKALEAADITVSAVSEVLIQTLNQEEPGQLGKLTRQMAEAGVSIRSLYSDHNHRLILTVDDLAKGRVVSEAWESERRPRSAERN